MTRTVGSFSEFSYPNNPLFNYDGAIYTVINDKNLLGSGRAGSVYKAVPDDPSRPSLAVKVVTERRCYDPCLGMCNEAGWNQRIHGIGFSSKKSLSLLMPLVIGENLHDFILNQSTVSDRTVMHYWILLALSVENLHKTHNAVHGDVKMANAMRCVNPGGSETIKLIDFQYTASVGMPAPLAGILPSCCREGGMAPELSDGSITATRAQDYYRLGSTLLCLLKRMSHVSQEVKTSVTKITNGLCWHNVQNRWCIPHAVYELECALTIIPRYPASATFCTLLDSHIDVLAGEMYAATQETIKLKTEKQTALREIQKALLDPRDLRTITQKVASVRKTYPKVTAGFFFLRTKTLLDELLRCEKSSTTRALQ